MGKTGFTLATRPNVKGSVRAASFAELQQRVGMYILTTFTFQIEELLLYLDSSGGNQSTFLCLLPYATM